MAEAEVVKALLFGDHQAKAAAAEAVVHLTNKQRHKLADNGAIPPIVSMLRSPPDFKSLESAIFALLSLAYGSERNKIRIAKSGAIPLLLNIVQSQIHRLIEHVIAALLILSSCSKNKPSMAASGAIGILNHCLLENNNSTQVKLDIIVTLHNLSTCHQLIPAIVSSRTVASLIQVINESEKSSKLVERSMALLEHMVTSSEIALKESASAIQALVETVEEGSKQCKEYAVGILLVICESSRERYRGMILREGAIPGLLQVSIDGTRRAKGSAKSLLRLLRDCSSVCRGERSKNLVFEQVMGEIDRGEMGGTEVGMVEEMIARLSTT